MGQVTRFHQQFKDIQKNDRKLDGYDYSRLKEV